MLTLPTLSTADKPAEYKDLINANEHYIGWALQQPHQKDLSIWCNRLFHIIPPQQKYSKTWNVALVHSKTWDVALVLDFLRKVELDEQA
uniref:Uncharacterized protein n=1 Tax=Romanomermis culicivorax TaxID=13658 RepID=A0A915J4E7_ROMCU